MKTHERNQQLAGMVVVLIIFNGYVSEKIVRFTCAGQSCFVRLGNKSKQEQCDGLSGGFQKTVQEMFTYATPFR